jgi:ankyrin repeat protein
MLKLLLDAGANPDIADNSGISARAVATSDPRAASITKLLKDVPVKATGRVQGPSL